MSPPERGSRRSGRRRRRSHQGNKRHAHQHLATDPHPGPFRGNRRRPRRRIRPQPQQPAVPVVCPTWIFNLTGHVHVARDRNWFSDDYVPFQTRIHDSRGIWFEAVGVGTVVLPIVQSDGERGEILLENVLHYPDAVCNIVGTLVSRGERVWTLKEDKSRPAVYFEPKRDKLFYPLMLSGPPSGTRLGRCPLEKKRNFLSELFWPEYERKRFEVSQGRAKVSQEEEEDEISDPLTDREKAWLKKYWRSEFQFLAAYGSNIYHEGDRSVGREFLRQFMAEDKKHEESQRSGMSEDEKDSMMSLDKMD